MGKTGMLPFRLLTKNHALNYLGFRIKYKKLSPNYRTMISSYPLDQNSLFIITFYNYIEKTKDYEFLKQSYEKLKKLINWNFSNDQDRDFLLEEGFFSNWMDHVIKSGKVLFTNVCHCYALKCFYNLAKLNKNRSDEKRFKEIYEKTKERINRAFWNNYYYIDWIDKKRRNYFDSVGNLLAIIWNIADSEKAEKILDFIKAKNLEGFTLKSSYPKYPFWRIIPHLKIVGIADYANYRLWIGCLGALTKMKTGNKKEAIYSLRKIAKKINDYNKVYEVYDKAGKPINKLFYKSEVPFAWSAGMFIYTANQLKK